MKKSINQCAMQVQKRFFEALDVAITKEVYNSLQDFCKRYDFNRTKYSWIRSCIDKPIEQMRYKTIDIDALTHLCIDAGVSADWLLTGRGEMHKKE